MRCVGYRQTWEAQDGTIPKKELRDRGIFATRQLAKRQITWLTNSFAAENFDCLDPALAKPGRRPRRPVPRKPRQRIGTAALRAASSVYTVGTTNSVKKVPSSRPPTMTQPICCRDSGAGTGGQRQRDGAEHHRAGGHQDRAQAQRRRPRSPPP